MKVPRLPEANIGLVGHVDHGKTTLTKALTKEWTDRHSEEIKRGISIKLGYADTAFFRCPKCAEPECFSIEKKCPVCGEKTDLLRAVSFVDSPGHETLMATMLSGAALMDGALLLVAANETCPQPQTREHLMALDICGIKRIIIVQNKIDLVGEEKARENHGQILACVKGTCAEGAPIVPVSAHHTANIDVLIQTIQETVPTQEHDASLPARMFIARSFDVNLPGTRPGDLLGGVVGGTLNQGSLAVDDEVEILPGRKVSERGQERYEPIRAKVVSLISGGKNYRTLSPGGLIAVGTSLDPAMTKTDGLVGNVLGKPGTLPPVWNELDMEVHLMERVVGTAEELRVEEIRVKEALMLNVGTTTTVGVADSVKTGRCHLHLKLPVVATPKQRVAISRRVGGRWRLIGYGILQ